MAEYPTLPLLQQHIPGLKTAELVHEGGQKAVFRTIINGATFALKMIHLDIHDDEDNADVIEVVERARREVSILDGVDVPVLTRGGPLGLSPLPIEDKWYLYFTEEWIEGPSLYDMIRQGSTTPKQVAQLGVDLIQATCWLNDKNLVHRDIKPRNVMWAVDRERFVLLDPGYALDLHGPSLTASHIVVGTREYLSPEQIDLSRKKLLDFRSDLFTIGVVLYEAAVGEHPFRAAGTSRRDVLGNILTMTPQPVANRVSEFPQSLSDFIDRLLGKKPHLRFRSCPRALATIEEIFNELGGTG